MISGGRMAASRQLSFHRKLLILIGHYSLLQFTDKLENSVFLFKPIIL